MPLPPERFDALPLAEQMASLVLRRQAARIGAREFVRFESRSITYGEADGAADRVANAFLAIGAGRGTRVGLLLRNRPEYLDLWFGLSRIGAIQVPLNTAYRSPQILHVLRRAPVPVVVVEASLAGELLPVMDRLPELRTVIVLDDASTFRTPASCRVVAYPEWLDGATSTAPVPFAVTGADVGAIMNTSGTTGPSKGVRLSHAQQYVLGRSVARDLALGPEDVYYNCFPLFHNTAQAMITLPVLLAGATMALVERFSASRFWPDMRAQGCTVFYYIGETLRMLLKSTSAEDARGTRLREGWGIGATPADFLEFQRRHGVRLRTGYGSTEGNVPVFLPHEGADPASVGRVIEGFELRVVNERGEPLPPGEPGEIVVRAAERCAIMLGYDGDDAATAAAWYGEWFRTGDAGRLDAAGNLYFLGRLRDAIRVRGENVSAFEVEQAIAEAPGVLEVAAIAVPGELGGDDVKVVVVPAPGAALDPAALVAHVEARLPKFALPRYVEFVASLPRTETNKVRKNVLRETAFTPATWDRLAAGR